MTAFYVTAYGDPKLSQPTNLDTDEAVFTDTLFSDSLRAGLGPRWDSKSPCHLPNAVIRVSIKRNAPRCGGFVKCALKSGGSCR